MWCSVCSQCPCCRDHFLKVHYMGGSGVDELTHSQGTLNGVSLIQTINVPGQNLQAAGVEGSHILLAHTHLHLQSNSCTFSEP